MIMNMMIKIEKEYWESIEEGVISFRILRRIIEKGIYIEYLLNVWLNEWIV